MNDDMRKELVYAGFAPMDGAVKPHRSRRHHGRPPIEATEKLADAKAELVRRFGITEPVAHRLLQRFSMECRIPFEYAADMIRLGLATLDILAADNGNTTE